MPGPDEKVNGAGLPGASGMIRLPANSLGATPSDVAHGVETLGGRLRAKSERPLLTDEFATDHGGCAGDIYMISL